MITKSCKNDSINHWNQADALLMHIDRYSYNPNSHMKAINLIESGLIGILCKDTFMSIFEKKFTWPSFARILIILLSGLKSTVIIMLKS